MEAVATVGATVALAALLHRTLHRFSGLMLRVAFFACRVGTSLTTAALIVVAAKRWVSFMTPGRETTEL